MARTREFDSKDALTKAMSVFWKKGYFDTSIDDLVAATGVSRYGLYGEFGNKHGLFLAALDHYQNTIIESIFGTVEHPKASLAEIRGFFSRLVKVSAQPAAKLGCLMCNSASEVAPHEPETAQKIAAFRKRLSFSFRRALGNAVAKGELPPSFDIKREADFFVGIVHAASALNRSGGGRKTVENMVSVALKTLEQR
ncbi:MAG: TetR/AcrR family transcriptional regulator [Alphaproteobacteria bacterium]|nr:TetR/AcrR family transcriptional regulator [Alphaproteobacteria bacterium]